MRQDPRLTVLERTNIRYLKLGDLPEGRPVDVVTLDLSFISILTVLTAVKELMNSDAELVTLIKPQFEARREQVLPNASSLPPYLLLCLILCSP